jgi:hypothetical protein
MYVTESDISEYKRVAKESTERMQANYDESALGHKVDWFPQEFVGCAYCKLAGDDKCLLTGADIGGNKLFCNGCTFGALNIIQGDN